LTVMALLFAGVEAAGLVDRVRTMREGRLAT
jgi:hypothetical protein